MTTTETETPVTTRKPRVVRYGVCPTCLGPRAVLKDNTMGRHTAEVVPPHGIPWYRKQEIKRVKCPGVGEPALRIVPRPEPTSTTSRQA